MRLLMTCSGTAFRTGKAAKIDFYFNDEARYQQLEATKYKTDQKNQAFTIVEKKK